MFDLYRGSSSSDSGQAQGVRAAGSWPVYFRLQEQVELLSQVCAKGVLTNILLSEHALRMKRFTCSPGQHSSGKALCILMAAAHVFLLAGTVIPLRINHRDVYLYMSPLPPCSAPVQQLVLFWTASFSLQLLMGSLSMPGHMLACRPTTMHILRCWFSLGCR